MTSPLVYTYTLILSTGLLILTLAPLLQSGYASSKSPYESRYDHGCDDADILDLGDRYINQPERGPSFHTDEFMEGYEDGYVQCSDVSDSESNELADWNDSCRDAGYNDGQNGPFNQPTYDHCGDEEGGDDAYFNGFINGCIDAGNTRDVCEQATDAG
jgi:hypothetical protein